VCSADQELKKPPAGVLALVSAETPESDRLWRSVQLSAEETETPAPVQRKGLVDRAGAIGIITPQGPGRGQAASGDDDSEDASGIHCA
jgi:hypothetical protein